MRTNSLKHKLAAGQPATVIAPFASSASLVELLGHLGFDGVFLDCEHGSSSWGEVEDMVRAADVAGYSSIVRVERNDPATITRALDRGASGVQVPHVNTAAEAAAVVQHAKFAPLGHRGWSGGRSAFGISAAEFAAHANAETLIAIMLEETEALDNLDAILRVDNIDVFFVAPGDLAQSMGYPGSPGHPRVQAAIDDTLRRVRAAGRVSGTLVTPGDLEHYLELGVLYVYVGMAALLTPAADVFVQRVRASSPAAPR
ncbi:MAG: aldolase/citrate lyase family protein [Chloroflexota bacterium]|nr:aldolase/citrate lyase family protein [Chloroflexota bacterium]